MSITPAFSVNPAVEELLQMHRLERFALAPDGRCAYALIVEASATGGLLGSLWWIDLHDVDRPARRALAAHLDVRGPLAVLGDGSAVVTATRRPPCDDERTGLWVVDPGDEATCVLEVEGGIEDFSLASSDGTVAIALAVDPCAESLVDSERQVVRNRSRGIDARRFTTYPVRRWNTWIGPLHRQIFRLENVRTPASLERLTPIALGDPERLDAQSFALSPDGRTLVAVRRAEPDAWLQTPDELIHIDLATGEERVLAGGRHQYSEVAISPDSRRVAAVRTTPPTPAGAETATLWTVELDTGEGRDLTPGFAHWPASPSWHHDGQRVAFCAWVEGRRPVFTVSTDLDEQARRLTGDGDHMYPQPLPGSDRIVAIHSSPVDPPALVTIGPEADDVRHVTQPPELRTLRARREELRTSVGAATVRSTLILPEGEHEEPLPLLVNIHGGPHECFSQWLWGLNAAVFVAAGFAVLQPDPAGTPGYGQAFVERMWGKWDVINADVLAAIDDATSRTDIDADRVALLGASFGGNLVNIFLGGPNRFKAGVSHAGAWDWFQYHGSSDFGRIFLLPQFGDPYTNPDPIREISPLALALSDEYTTPLLLTHGERDYRVPIDQTLKAWTALRAQGAPAELLIFPTEDHHINRPANAAVWYDAALEFLARHV
ncbi:MAG: prolyl oligopeptidase family serine peptidase [Conexibacter sp.]